MSCLGGSLRSWSAFVYFCFVFQIFKLGFKDIILLSQICRVCWTIWIMMSGTPLPSRHSAVERNRMPASSDLTLDHE